MVAFCVLLALPVVHAWEHEPLATELHPVQSQLALRHRELMSQVSAAQRANPIYRSAWSAMDTHWAMVAAGQEATPFTAGQTERYVSLAAMAAESAGEALLREVVAGSPALSVFADGARAVLAPSLSLRKRSDPVYGTSSVAVTAGGGAVFSRNQMAHAAAEDPRERAGRDRHALTVGLASGLRPYENDSVDAPSTEYVVTSYVSARSFGVDSLRISTDVLAVHADDGLLYDWPGLWRVTAHERLGPRWTALSTLRSATRSYVPDVMRPALAWRMLPDDDDWYVVGSYEWNLPGASVPELERTAMLRVSWSADWVMPTSPDRWPLGQRIGAGGPAWPEHRTTRQNALHTPGTVAKEQSLALAR